MSTIPPDIEQILGIKPKNFEEHALHLFRYQAETNLVYKDYINALKIAPKQIQTIAKIPFLPIRFFKTHRIVCGNFTPEAQFTSSGTTGENTSNHFVKRVADYKLTFTSIFKQFVDVPERLCILALMPGYLEREGSSLIYMMKELIALSKHPHSGFFLYNHEDLYDILRQNERSGQKTWLIGVTYALLDFAERFPIRLRNTIIMETGGMKGKRQEMIRPAVHHLLCTAFGATAIWSEYGMTELMSQAYSPGEGVFHSPHWMRVLLRDTDDPLTTHSDGKGVINIIDLANIHSCAFIATDDLGEVHSNGTFSITGRMDHADIRGCNLLVY